MKSSFVGWILLSSIAGCAVGTPPVFQTAPGADTRSVLDGVRGRLAIAHAGDDVPCEYLQSVARSGSRSCLLFADLQRPSGVGGVVPESDASLFVLRLERDPDAADDASFVLVRRHCPEARTACRPDEQRIASWKAGSGGALYRKQLALSPDGRRLALLPASSLVRMTGFAPPAPDGYRFADQQHVGELVVVDWQTGVARGTGIDVLDEQPITWSADGRRLLVVRAETVSTLTPAMREELHGREGEPGRTIPVIESIDVDSGAVRMLAIGLTPTWSADEKTLLYAPVRAAPIAFVADGDPTVREERADAFELRDLDSGRRTPVSLPGLIRPIAFVGPHAVLYWSLPVAHVPPRMTTHNSPLIGPKQMLSLRVGDLDTQEAATVVRYIDPRAQVGYR